MAEPTVIPPGGGEVVGDSPDRRVEILCERDALHATWTRFGPRRAGADPHIHRDHTDLFYVLAGELTVLLGPEREEVRVPAGTLVRVPPLVVHGFRNDGDAELRYLNFHVPGCGFADYMRGLRDFDQAPPPADGGRPAGEAAIGAAAGDFEEVEGEPSRPLDRCDAASFYVLEGEVVLTAGERELRARAGSWVDVPAGVAHMLSFPVPTRFLSLRS